MNTMHRILIVDDESFNIKVLTEYLQGDYKIMVAKTGEQALKAVKSKTPPDLILLDIIMPGMNGYEICERIKGDEETSNIPIIFVTAVSEVMDSAKAFDLGGVDYITKPFHPVTVKARVNTHIKLSSTLRALETALAEVKMLSKLLPICSKCKKIRDDKGYWTDIDHFLTRYSNTKFSHGICPDCLEKLYGERDWYKTMKSEQDNNS